MPPKGAQRFLFNSIVQNDHKKSALTQQSKHFSTQNWENKAQEFYPISCFKHNYFPEVYIHKVDKVIVTEKLKLKTKNKQQKKNPSVFICKLIPTICPACLKGDVKTLHRNAGLKEQQNKCNEIPVKLLFVA